MTVEPSKKIGEDGTGVYVQVNDHYAIEDPKSQNATNEIVSILEKSFDDSVRLADQIIDHIMSLRALDRDVRDRVRRSWRPCIYILNLGH